LAITNPPCSAVSPR